MRTAWLIGMLSVLAAPAAAESFLPRAIAPEQGVEVLSRAEAVRLTGRKLLADPAGGAVYGDIHIYDRFPYIESRWVSVTSDAGWGRLLFGRPGESPRAWGSRGDAPGQLREPRGLAFAPDGRLFVTDRALGRLSVLKLEIGDDDQPTLVFLDYLDGLVQPMDVAVHDGGTPADPADDRVLVAEAGAERVAVFGLEGNHPVRQFEFGTRGPGIGEFLYPRALAVGRRGGVCSDEVFVADSGNHRLVRLRLGSAGVTWENALPLPMEAVSVDADAQGNLLLALRRADQIWKVSPSLEPLATYTGGAHRLVAPRDVAVPFAWVHDHRSATSQPTWRGEGSVLLLEAWGDESGVRLVDLGVAIADLRREGSTGLQFRLSDAAHVTAEVVDASGTTRSHDLGQRDAGSLGLDLPDLDGASSVRVAAISLYDPARRDEKVLQLGGVPRRVALGPNVPNPFNPSTRVGFDLPAPGRVVLEVFDVRGRRIRGLVDAELPAGPHSVLWDGRDDGGRVMPSGVYFSRLRALETTLVRKMVMAQ